MIPHHAQLFWEIYKNLIIWSIYTYNHIYRCVLGTWIHRDIFTYICTYIYRYIYIYTLSNRCFFYNLLIQFHEILHLYHIKPFHEILRLLHAFFSCTYICLHTIHISIWNFKRSNMYFPFTYMFIYTYIHLLTKLHIEELDLLLNTYTYIYIHTYTYT